MPEPREPGMDLSPTLFALRVDYLPRAALGLPGRLGLTRETERCVLLRVGRQFHDAGREFVRMFFGDLRRCGRGAQQQPRGRSSQQRGNSDGNQERADRSA